MVGELLVHTIFFFCFTGSVSTIDPLLTGEAVESILFFKKKRGLNKLRGIVDILINLKMDGVLKKKKKEANSLSEPF